LAAVAGLWPRFEGATLERVEVVEQAISALLEGEISKELRRKAEWESHKLAGSVGSFGFKEASRIAAEIERSFRAKASIGQGQALALSELAATLRRELESRPAGRLKDGLAPSNDSRPVLLIVDSDQKFAQLLADEARRQGRSGGSGKRSVSSRESLGRCSPDVVILDLSLPKSLEMVYVYWKS